MKRILFALLFVVGTANAQYFTYKVKDWNNNKVYSFEYSPILKQHLDEWFSNAEKMNMEICVLEKLGGVFWSNQITFYTKPSFGLALMFKDSPMLVLVDDNIPTYLPTFINAVLYHELAHLFTKNNRHPKHGVPYILQDGKNIKIENVIKTWNDEAKIEYFQYLKLKMK